MVFTPNDIRNIELSTQMRGYHKEEVDDLLEQVAQALESEKQQNLRLTMEVDSLKQQLATLREFEDTIKNAAIDARRHADQTMADARKEAESILAGAKAQVDRALGSQSKQLQDLRMRLAKAEEIKDSYLNKLRELIETHLHMVDATDTTAFVALKEDIEVTDSSEVERDSMETVGTEYELAADDGGKAPAAGRPTDTTPPGLKAETPPQAQQEGQAPIDEETAAGVDPELAEALARYQSQVRRSADSAADERTLPRSSSQPSESGSDLADVIPPGYWTKDPETKQDITGKVPIIRDSDRDASKIAPEQLAEALDKVVAKFEETMDQAAKSK